jgi:MFS family permease
MGCYLFSYTGRLAIGHAMPLMEQDLGYSKQQLGWLTASALAAYGVGQAINGNLGDRLGGRLMVTLGYLIGEQSGYGYPALFLTLAMVTGTGALLALASVRRKHESWSTVRMEP